jgi:sRNA-binding protein
VKITGIHYHKKFSLGNYENHEIGLAAELDETDDLTGAITGLITEVHLIHTRTIAEAQAREEAERERKRKEFEERKQAAIAQMKANATTTVTDDEDEPF